MLAAADERLGALAQAVPLGAQVLRLVRRHAPVGDGVGHVGDEQAELADQRVGRLVEGAGGGFRLDRRELPAGLRRQPVEDARVASSFARSLLKLLLSLLERTFQISLFAMINSLSV